VILNKQNKMHVLVITALNEAGWNINRKINTEGILRILKNEGYQTSTQIESFLGSFGNLVIRFTNKKSGIIDDINYNVEHATHVENAERIRDDYIPRVGKELCIIGSAYRDHFCLMMATDGSVYGGYTDFLYKIADTGLGGIEAIILDYDFVTIT
jgi:hypothetical protein